MKAMLCKASVLAFVAVTFLETSARADFAGDVAEARSRVPLLFTAVDDVVAHADEIDAQGRKAGIPPTARLKALGPNALFPMLDVLVTGRGLSAVRTDSARDALRIGLLEAIGSVRDGRAVPFLERELAAATAPRLVRAAATALARIGTDGAVDVLDRSLQTARADDTARQRAVLEGLHDCRRARAASLLAARLDVTADESTATLLARSLGGVANAWAWLAMADRTELVATRDLAAGALLRAYVQRSGEAREAAAKALLVVDAPDMSARIARARSGASADVAAALDALSARLARNPARL